MPGALHPNVPVGLGSWWCFLLVVGRPVCSCIQVTAKRTANIPLEIILKLLSLHSLNPSEGSAPAHLCTFQLRLFPCQTQSGGTLHSGQFHGISCLWIQVSSHLTCPSFLSPVARCGVAFSVKPLPSQLELALATSFCAQSQSPRALSTWHMHSFPEAPQGRGLGLL